MLKYPTFCSPQGKNQKNQMSLQEIQSLPIKQLTNFYHTHREHPRSPRKRGKRRRRNSSHKVNQVSRSERYRHQPSMVCATEHTHARCEPVYLPTADNSKPSRNDSRIIPSQVSQRVSNYYQDAKSQSIPESVRVSNPVAFTSALSAPVSTIFQGEQVHTLCTPPNSPLVRQQFSTKNDVKRASKAWTKVYEVFDYWIFYRIEEQKLRLREIQARREHLKAIANL